MPASTSSSTRPEGAPDGGAGRDDLWVTVLAGGIGSRFWPLSTPERPKQLLPLAGERPLIVETVDRARSLAPDARIRILTGHELVEPIRRALPGLPGDAFLIEPRARGTAPVLAWAAWAVARRDPDAVLVSLHSDHVVRPEDAFTELVRDAAAVAVDHATLVTIAVPPDRPEIGYGYIQPGRELRSPGESRAFRVGAFHEKPDSDTASRYVDEGYLWNSGIFVWPARLFLDEVSAHAPEIGTALAHLEAGEVERYFAEVPSISVDEAVLERSDRVAAVEATFQWDDVGNWESLARTRPGDEEGNVVVGEGSVFDGTGNVVYTEDGPVVLFGVEDLVVARRGDVTLVTRRSLAPRLKDLLERLPDDVRNR